MSTITHEEFARLDHGEQAERMAALARVALGQFGIESDAALTLVGYRENAVFRVDAGQDRYALKVHRDGYHSDAELRSELAWMQALRESGLRTPQFLETLDGNAFAILEHGKVPAQRQVDLSVWVDGQPLGDLLSGTTTRGEALREAMQVVGESAARIHNHDQDWRRPTGFTRFAWNADGLTGADPLWGRFWEITEASAEQAQLLRDARDKLRCRLLEFGEKPDRYGLIHADLVEENVMQVGDEFMLIDFDDAGFGWHCYDLATSLFFQYIESPASDFATLVDAWLEGYHRQRDFSDEQLNRLPDLLLARGLTVTAWCHTRRETETSVQFLQPLLETACSLSRHYLSDSGQAWEPE